MVCADIILECRLAGPPLTALNAVATFVGHNVSVALGTPEAWAARNARFDAGWVRRLLLLQSHMSR